MSRSSCAPVGAQVQAADGTLLWEKTEKSQLPNT